MNLWQWLGRKFKNRSRGVEARAFLAFAYKRVFVPGHVSTDEDKQIVLADLANFSGFYRASGIGFSGEDRANMDGMRVVYGRILQHIRITDDESRDLEEAARQEALEDARYQRGE